MQFDAAFAAHLAFDRPSTKGLRRITAVHRRCMVYRAFNLDCPVSCV